MRKVILYIAMSLDGFIADSKGGVSWIKGEDENISSLEHYDEFISSVDTVIIGNNTYEQIISELSPTSWVYKDLTSYVLTHKNLKSKENIIFTNQELSPLIKFLKEEKDGKDIWICGGANIANIALKEDLIDEFFISVIPTILGSGLRLFNDDNEEKKLKLTQSKIYNSIVELKYERKE